MRLTNSRSARNWFGLEVFRPAAIRLGLIASGHSPYFQTKSFDDPSIDIYLLDGPRMYGVVRGMFVEPGETAAQHGQLEGHEAVFKRRHAIEPIVSPREIVFYTSCDECPPVLVRSDRARAWGRSGG